MDERNRPGAELRRGYESQWELMGDLFSWLDLRLYFFYRHHQWLGPKNEMRNMLGLVVSREEFEQHKSRAFVQETFGGSLPGFLAAFLGGRRLSARQADELQQLIDRCREEGDNE